MMITQLPSTACAGAQQGESGGMGKLSPVSQGNGVGELLRGRGPPSCCSSRRQELGGEGRGPSGGQETPV